MKIRSLFLCFVSLLIEALLLVLANWQWGRYHQRLAEQALLATRPPVLLNGLFQNEKTVALTNQPNPANPEEQVGWRILTPFKTTAGTVIIDRGWSSPHFQADGITPNFTPFTTSSSQVKGVPQSFPVRKGWLKGPDTTTHPRLLAFLNPQRITSQTTGRTYVIAQKETGGEGLTPALPPVPAPLRHLSYALQWLGMALVFPLLCLGLILKNRRRMQS